MKKLSSLLLIYFFAATALSTAQSRSTATISQGEEKIEEVAISIPASDEILGIWWSPEKDAKIEIYKENNKYFGKIIWLQNPSLKDERNEDPVLNGRSIIGIHLLEGFTYNKRKKEWQNGTVYEPYRGKSYGSFLKLDKKNINRLLVRGFVMSARFLGKTEIFTRVN